jgi:hypothetical protein
MPPTIAMGQEAIDGPLAFRVLMASPWTVGYEGDPKPQGVLQYIGLEVKNVGTSQHSYGSEYQRLVDTQGREYSPDVDRIERDYAKYRWGPHIDINPSNTATTVLFFDVPEGTQPSNYVLLLRSSPDSHGVTASLT